MGHLVRLLPNIIMSCAQGVLTSSVLCKQDNNLKNKLITGLLNLNLSTKIGVLIQHSFRIGPTMRTLLSLLLVAAVALATSNNNGKVTYHGQQVLRVQVENQHEFNLLSEMRGQLNFWHEPAVGRFADIQVSKDSTLPAKLTALGLSYTVYVEDVQALIDGSFESIEKRKLEFEAGESKATIDLDSYHRLDAIYSWFDDLASKCTQNFSLSPRTFAEALFFCR